MPRKPVKGVDMMLRRDDRGLVEVSVLRRSRCAAFMNFDANYRLFTS